MSEKQLPSCRCLRSTFLVKMRLASLIGKKALQICAYDLRIHYVKLQGLQSYYLSRVPCVPVIPDVRFFDASSESDKNLYNVLECKKLPTSELLTMYIIPKLTTQP